MPITTLVALVLAACASVTITPNPHEPVPEEKPAVTSTSRPKASATPAPTETPVVSQVEQLLTAHLAGESIGYANKINFHYHFSYFLS
ncbi:MAG: hypothetical protein HPY76_08195 [Anaerolineae bacterium]|nr:hypothetical protein [Anaerolineae bacterium]